MRKETQKIAEAWWLGSEAKAVRTKTDGVTIWLHDNAIIWRSNKGYHLTLAGWPTVTTRERLNGALSAMGAPHAGFSQKNHKQYFTDLKGETREIEDDEIIFIGK